jgi:glycerophosphoryl diester phosphodiesterase
VIEGAVYFRDQTLYFSVDKHNRFLTKGELVLRDHWVAGYSYAHRGLHTGEMPENTLPAFENAIRHGFGIELDVQLSGDGEVVVFHDREVFRLTGKEGCVSAYTAAELGKMPVGGTVHTIPALKEVLALVGGRVPLLIETKNAGGAGALEQALYKQMQGYSGAWAVQSFWPFCIGLLKMHAPKNPRGPLSAGVGGWADGTPGDKLFFVRRLLTNFLCRPNFISYEHMDLQNGTVQRLRENGIPVLAWTVRTEKEAAQAKMLADNIIFEGFLPIDEGETEFGSEEE